MGRQFFCFEFKSALKGLNKQFSLKTDVSAHDYYSDVYNVRHLDNVSDDYFLLLMCICSVRMLNPSGYFTGHQLCNGPSRYIMSQTGCVTV